MYSYAITGLAALAGYIVTIALALAATVGIASARPKMVLRDHRIQPKFKLLHELVWLVCAAIGGYVTARLGGGGNDVEQKLLLTVALLAVLWLNSWEARQRGTPHQILISAFTIAGVFGGYALHRAA